MVIPTPPPRQKLPPKLQTALNWVGHLGRPAVMSTLATGTIILGLRTLGALQGLELGVYDNMLRWRPTPPPDDRILVVGISESDIQSRQEWPIQDSTVAELLEVLLEAEPQAIGLDMFRDLPIGAGQAELLSVLQSSDRIFPVCKISSADNPGVPPPTDTLETQVGFSDLVVDSGGILRRNLLIAAPPAETETVDTHLCNSPDNQLFSLSLQLALRYLAAEGINPELTLNQELQLGQTVLPRLTPNLGGYRNVDANGYQILLNYRAAQAAVPQVSLTDVLTGQVEPAQVRDRIVLIGATTPEAKDEFYTPFSGGLRDSQKMSGVIVHAQSVSQILSAVLDDRPLLWSWSPPVEALWIVAWGLGGALFAGYIRRPMVYAVVAIGLLGGLYGLCYVAFLQGGWLPLVPAALGFVLASGGVLLLDRFNKSDYGQAVYKQMKSLLRIEIEIDKTKVGEQVAEITDTDYFNQLQAQAKELRAQRQARLSNPDHTPPPVSPSASESAAPPANSPSNNDDYFADLLQKSNRLKSQDQSDEQP
ncbi:MAG: CHASE2 domain-containing protein [Cyanobacteria bacterium P01_H01_bin.162]